MGQKGLGKCEVRNEDGEVVMHLDENQVNGLMADVFTGFRRTLDRHARFDDYCRDHPRPDEQADPSDPALD
jgi:hypothetical protein